MKAKPKRTQRAAAGEVEVIDPAFPVALLRIALALKLHPDAGLDPIIEQTTRSMGLSRADFRGYLAHHMAMLATAATDKPARDTAARDTAARERPARDRPARTRNAVVSTPRVRPRIKMRSPR